MERLTNPDSDYCHDICGGVNGCPRLLEDKKRCSGYDLYERLKQYENTGLTPEKIKPAIDTIVEIHSKTHEYWDATNAEKKKGVENE